MRKLAYLDNIAFLDEMKDKSMQVRYKKKKQGLFPHNNAYNFFGICKYEVLYSILNT